MSLDTPKQIDEYILAKQKIITYKYSNKRKIEEAQKIEKQNAEDEIRKMIGNQILSFERVLLKQRKNILKLYIIMRQKIWCIIYLIVCIFQQDKKKNT